jgi:anti-sigma regulatory factor (Ser/Thr protein kinase)
MSEKNALAAVCPRSDHPNGRPKSSAGKLSAALRPRGFDHSTGRGSRRIRGDTAALAIVLSEQADVRVARECAGVLARAAGLPEPGMVEMAVGEVGNNCLEHRDGPGAAVLKLGCRAGKLILEAENPCGRPPTWQTTKPEVLDGLRVGGYGLQIVRSLARDLRYTWSMRRVVVRAEFAR